MRPTIDLAFVDDWELRGNGSGDPRVLQFEPMRQLASIYDKHGLRGSFNVEVLQQLAHRRHQDRYPELRDIADEWDESVRQAYRKGHDIQPHIHPQWDDATYLGSGGWDLRGDWSIINYPAAHARRLICAAVRYLENLLRPINRQYRCVSFRAGSWCIAPSEHILGILAEQGFVFDMSIVAGIRYDTPHVRLDYRHCDEAFLPYYPVMTDARLISATREPIVCIPTHAFGGARVQFLLRDVQLFSRKLARKLFTFGRLHTGAARGLNSDEWTNHEHTGVLGKTRKLITRYAADQLHISDLGRLSFGMMKVMLADIRSRALQSRLPIVPVILENHTKDVLNFSDIDRFLAMVRDASDIRIVTLSQIAERIAANEYVVRTNPQLAAAMAD